MYCVKCGVELADSERKCPLCMTPVYLPGISSDPERPFPKFDKPEKVNPRGIIFIITFVCLISAIISFVCDFNLGNGITWSGYAIGGIALFYVIFILPFWFKKYNPAIFVPSGFAAIAAFVAYVNFEIDGNWFLTFAFPIIGATCLVFSSICILSYYLKRGYLYIWGGAFLAIAALAPVIEILANATFGLANTLVWSLYPVIAFGLIGIMLIIIAIVKPLRESLCRIFAI
jgi:hypothetical protein